MDKGGRMDMSSSDYHEHWLHFPGESIVYETSGFYSGRKWDIVLTEKNIVFIRKKIIGSDSRSIWLSGLDSVEYKGFLMFWNVYLKSGTFTYKVELAQKEDARGFARAVDRQLKKNELEGT